MNTEDLIRALSADSKKRPMRMRTLWLYLLPSSLLISSLVFFSTLGLRPDILLAAHTWRFLFKFLVTLTLTVSAFVGLRAMLRPESKLQQSATLLFAPVLLLAAVVGELILVPPSLWLTKLVGTNSLLCLAFIPLIGVGPLALLLIALRHGASTRPSIAGGLAGLLAGGISSTLYAAHCFDDSPLFVAVWYSLATLVLAAIGSILGPKVARW